MFRLGAVVLALMTPTPALAQSSDAPTDVADPADPGSPLLGEPFTITGGVTLASQYRYRGISMSDDHGALQGAINIGHESGFYAGLWASSLDGFGERGGSNAELDLYAGYGATIGSGVSLDAGLLYYAFPGSKGGDFEFFEPYANVSGTLGPATAKVGISYAWEQDALGGNSNAHLFGDLAAGIPGTPVTLKTHLGYSRGDTRLAPGGDYFDWLVGADYTRKNLTLGIAYVDTDLTGGRARIGGAIRDIVDPAVVLSVTAAF